MFVCSANLDQLSTQLVTVQLVSVQLIVAQTANATIAVSIMTGCRSSLGMCMTLFQLRLKFVIVGMVGLAVPVIAGIV